VQHGIMRRRLLNGHRQAELAREQAAVAQQRQPCVADDCLQLCSELQLALTTHVIHCEQQVVTVGQLGGHMNLNLVTETWTPVQQSSEISTVNVIALTSYDNINIACVHMADY